MKAWCTAVQAPAPTATSPLSVALDDGSNSGASTIQTNAHADSSMSPQRRPISRRAAPSSARDGGALAGGEEHAVARRRADALGQARALGLAEVLGDRAAELAVLPHEDVGQAAGTALLGPLLPGVELLRGCDAPPGMTTAPTYGAWNTRNGRVGEVVGALDELVAEAQVGLVVAVARHRLGVGHPRRSAARSRGR